MSAVEHDVPDEADDAPAPAAINQIVYDQLRREARILLSQHVQGSVTPTMLVHDAYVRLAEHGGAFENELHFRHAAALAMRHVLVDRARRRGSLKRGEGWARVTLGSEGAEAAFDVDVIALNDALEELTAFDPDGAALVQLRYFGDLDNVQIAEMRGVSQRTVERDLRAARAWLLDRLERS